MVTKKRRATPKVAEAAPSYTAAKTGSLGEALWELFLKLPEDDEGAFFEKMLEDPQWREDISDTIIIIESRGEPTRPFDEYVAERERERAR